jgi:hypothetical protein
MKAAIAATMTSAARIKIGFSTERLGLSDTGLEVAELTFFELGFFDMGFLIINSVAKIVACHCH